MEYGRLNEKFGWLWFLVFALFGFFLELKLSDLKWFEEFAAMPRQVWRTSHTHGMTMGILNILYGMYIDKVALGDTLKKWGSYLLVIGTVIFPLALLIGGLVPSLLPLAAIGALCFILSLAIMLYGILGR